MASENPAGRTAFGRRSRKFCALPAQLCRAQELQACRRMKPFVVNRFGRLVFPSNYLPELDFTVFDTLEQFEAVIARDFETKAPTGSDILQRIDSGQYPTRHELLRDLA